MLPPFLVVGAGDSTRSPERRLASDAHADINLLSGTRRAPPAGGVPPVSRCLRLRAAPGKPAHLLGASEPLARSAVFRVAFGFPTRFVSACVARELWSVDHQPLRRSRRSCRHHRPERASNEVLGCGTQVRPIPPAASTRNLARFTLRASVSGAVPLAAQHGFANSGRGPEGRRCPVAADTINAGFRRGHRPPYKRSTRAPNLDTLRPTFDGREPSGAARGAAEQDEWPIPPDGPGSREVFRWVRFSRSCTARPSCPQSLGNACWVRGPARSSAQRSPSRRPASGQAGKTVSPLI